MATIPTPHVSSLILAYAPANVRNTNAFTANLTAMFSWTLKCEEQERIPVHSSSCQYGMSRVSSSLVSPLSTHRAPSLHRLVVLGLASRAQETELSLGASCGWPLP